MKHLAVLAAGDPVCAILSPFFPHPPLVHHPKRYSCVQLKACSVCGPSEYPTIYQILNLLTGSSYVGVSTNPRRRYNQHRGKPPRRMRAHAAIYSPFHEHFQLRIIQRCMSRDEAKEEERKWIQHYRSDKEQGYNTLQGHPPASRRGWAVIRSAQKRAAHPGGRAPRRG